jgi:hypothetical protein
VGLLAVAVVVAALLCACGDDDGEEVRADRPAAEPAPPDRTPDSTGPVSVVTDNAVRVDHGTGLLTAVQARVDDATRVLRRRDDVYEEIALDALDVGDRIELWVDGPVAESFPVQAHAEAIVVGG